MADFRLYSSRANARSHRLQSQKDLKVIRRLDASRPDNLVRLVRMRGANAVGTLLANREASRLDALAKISSILPASGWRTLAVVPLTDNVAIRVGANWITRLESREYSWPETLMNAVDDTVNALRLLRVGNFIGAVAIARHQLERWSLNIAHTYGVEAQRRDESSTDYLRRIWEVYPDLMRNFDPGVAWGCLSEWLHGRSLGHLHEFEWHLTKEGNLAEDLMPADIQASYDIVAQTLEITLSQIRAGFSQLSAERNDYDAAAALQKEVTLCETPTEGSGRFKLLYPLDIALVGSEVADEIISVGREYRTIVTGRAAYGNLKCHFFAELSEMAMIERRARAIMRAREAFYREHELLGEDFNPSALLAKLFRYFAIAEAATIVASWNIGHERDALTIAGNALRSAYWIWLEDSDFSLTCMRSVLEQTCRSRAWRIKPQRATRVESMGSTASPVRWVEAAGYARLGVLSRALGEFAHINFRTRRVGARVALEQLQSPSVEHRMQQARGFTLEAAAYLLAHEIAARLDAVSHDLSEAFREAVTLMPEDTHDAQIEELLARGMALRGHDFGSPDYRARDDSSTANNDRGRF